MISYFIQHFSTFATAFLEHLWIVLVTLVIFLLMATVISYFVVKSERISNLVVQIFSAVYSIPSLVLFAILIPITGLGNKTAIISGILWGCCLVEKGNFVKQYSHAIIIAVPFSEMLTLKGYREQEFWTVQQATYPILTELEERLINFFERRQISCRNTAGMDASKPLTAEFSLKDGARRAGIGWIGKNSLLVTHQYGPRVSLTGILVDAPLQIDNPIEESRCGDCTLCIKSCPFHALYGNEWNKNTTREDLINYQSCNEGRSRALRTKLGRKLACGKCMVACPYGVG